MSFEEAGASAFTIVSADPAQNTPIASLSAETAITLTASSGVGYVTAMLRDTGDSDVAYQLSAAVDEADPTRIVLSYQWGKIDLYEGHAYEITVTAYASYDDWLTGQAAIGSAVVRYAGATEAVESMARVVSVSPEPGVLYPTADQMLSRAEGRRAVTIEFDGKVSVQMCAILLGYGTSTDCESVTAEATAEGHTVVTAVIPESFFTRHYEALLSITVTDENGNKLDDKDGPYARFFSGGSYVFDFALADARVADASMQASEVVPAAGSYVEALDTVALTVTGEVPVAVTYKANAGLYRDGAKAYDVKLTTDVDENGFVTMDNRHVYATFYEPGTDTKVTVTEPGSYVLRIDSLSIADANMDVDAPWVDGYSGKGICNPDWEFEYTVVRELPAVVAVDPEPYTEGGEYSQEIPAFSGLPSLAAPVAAAGGAVGRVVLGQLGHLAPVDERARAPAVLVDAQLRLEEHVYVLHVLRGGEVLGRVARAGGEAELERAEVVELHALGALQLLLHHHHQLAEHGEHVGPLHGAVGLNLLGQPVGVCGVYHHRPGIPLLVLRAARVVVLVKSVLYCHSLFPFLCFLVMS